MRTSPGTPAAAEGSETTGWIAFRSRDFTLLCSARFLSGLALQMYNVAVGWRIYELTHSPLALGLVGLAAFVPAIALALVTGEVADRVDRRLILRVAFAVEALVGASLALHVLAGATDSATIYALVVLFGTASAFANPASQALLPNLVPREHFANAVAWNSSAWQTATIAGPALGGVLYAFGPAVVFGLSAAFYAVGFGLMMAIRPGASQPLRTKTDWESLIAGIRFIRERPLILGAISLDLFAVLLGGATALLPIYAAEILHVGPWGLGVLRCAPAVGAALTALALAQIPLRRRTGHRLFQAVAIFGFATIGFGLSTDLFLSLAFLLVSGAADMISVFIRLTLVQSDTPDAMRGRVSAVNSVFIGASNQLGEFESGVMAAAVGPVSAVVVGGLGTLAVAALWAWAFPALRKRDKLVE